MALDTKYIMSNNLDSHATLKDAKMSSLHSSSKLSESLNDSLALMAHPDSRLFRAMIHYKGNGELKTDAAPKSSNSSRISSLLLTKDSLVNLRATLHKRHDVSTPNATFDRPVLGNHSRSLSVPVSLPETPVIPQTTLHTQGRVEPHEQQSMLLRKRSPMDDLQERVAAKRQRMSSTPGNDVSLNGKARKTVRFATELNQVYQRDYMESDLAEAWISPLESQWIRDSMCFTIACFRSGRLDLTEDTMRGLEFRATNEITEEKIRRGRQHQALILEQQRFFQGLMGKTNEQMLSKMSEILSAEDAASAAAMGERDYQEAIAEISDRLEMFKNSILLDSDESVESGSNSNA